MCVWSNEVFVAIHLDFKIHIFDLKLNDSFWMVATAADRGLILIWVLYVLCLREQWTIDQMKNDSL